MSGSRIEKFFIFLVVYQIEYSQQYFLQIWLYFNKTIITRITRNALQRRLQRQQNVNNKLLLI